MLRILSKFIYIILLLLAKILQVLYLITKFSNFIL